MSGHIHLCAFTQCSPCPQAKGQWRNPRDQSSPGYRDVEFWVDIARTLDRGLVDALFFADIHGVYDVYGGSMEAGVRHAVQFPGNDPSVLLPLLARETRGLGFVVTHSTSYYPPFHTAKLFSSLDHFAGGRVGWNIVTSYLDSAARNGMGGAPLPHDQRYDRADEFMEVVGKLWEKSWRDGSVVRDAEADVHTDPSGVRKIHHTGVTSTWKAPTCVSPPRSERPFCSRRAPRPGESHSPRGTPRPCSSPSAAAGIPAPPRKRWWRPPNWRAGRRSR